MQYNIIHDKLYTPEFSSQFENEFIELYKLKQLSLNQIPHNYRSDGYFYDECKRLGEFDLIPTLLKEDRVKLKIEYDILMNSLNRVDSKSLQIIRVKANEHFYRALTYQILNEGIYLSEDIREKINKTEKKIEEFTNEELFTVCETFISYLTKDTDIFVYMFIPDIILKGFTVEDIINLSKNELSQTLNYQNFPTLFTGVSEVSFDQGGLVKLEFYQS